MSNTFVFGSMVLMVFLVACDTGPEGKPTGATCPPNSTLTYENFGAPFAEAYCTRCHSSELSGEDRNGAPLYHDFDTRNGILAVANHVDEYAAGGPNGINRIMPESDPRPTDDERLKLGEWLACEVAP